MLKRIAGLYAVEKDARGQLPDERVRLRQARAKPIFDDLEVWLHAQLPKISGKSELANLATAAFCGPGHTVRESSSAALTPQCARGVIAQVGGGWEV